MVGLIPNLAGALGLPVTAPGGLLTVFELSAALTVPCLCLVATRAPRGLRVRPVSLGDLGATLRERVIMSVLFT